MSNIAIMIRQLREKRKLTQKELAEKARVGVATIARIECGEKVAKRRTSTLERLAKALDVEPGMLTGEQPVESDWLARLMPYSEPRVKMLHSALNALELVSQRYRVTPDNILNAAPFLFHLLAGESLLRRNRALGVIEKAWETFEAAAIAMPHLGGGLNKSPRFDELLGLEDESIERNDIFGREVDAEDGISDYRGLRYSEDVDNPFARYIRDKVAEIAASLDGWQADFQGWDASGGPNCDMCQSQALDFVGCDQAAADALLRGSVLISEIPDGLRKSGQEIERALWVNSRAAESEREFESRLSKIPSHETEDKP